MRVASNLQKTIIFGVLAVLAVGTIYSTKKNINPSNITDKSKEVASDYIDTQEELESKGYKFTFGFPKGEDKLKKSKVLENKDSMETELKKDSNKFDNIMNERLLNASYLANRIRQTLNNSKVLDGGKLSSKEKRILKEDSEKLIDLYNNDIMSMEFPESELEVKDKLKSKGKCLESELGIMISKLNKMDSDEVLAIDRIMGTFADYCNEIAE